MNVESTKEKMTQLKQFGMLRTYDNLLKAGMNELTHDEVIAMLIDSEWDERHNKRITRLQKRANFRYSADSASVSYSASRNLDKGQFLRLASCSWIKSGDNVIITGATGVGKSYLASALGQQACKIGYRVLYYNFLKLVSSLFQARGDGSYHREIKKIRNHDLLILDDFGLQVLDGASRIAFLEILEDRHGRKSTLLTSQIPTGKWHSIIGEETLADSICDRLLHNAHKIQLKGESLRKKNAADEKSSTDS